MIPAIIFSNLNLLLLVKFRSKFFEERYFVYSFVKVVIVVLCFKNFIDVKLKMSCEELLQFLFCFFIL